MRQTRIAWIIICILLGSTRIVSAQVLRKPDDKKDTQTARAAYLELVRISQLPETDQEKKIPSLYRDMEQDLLPLAERLRYTSYGVGPITRPLQETPEAFADSLMAKGSWIELYFSAEGLLTKLLAKFPAAVQPLVAADLHSPDTDRQLRGLSTLTRIDLPGRFEDVISLYLKPANIRVTQEATRVLFRMHDPRTLERILPLLRKPAYPDNFFSLLENFSAQRPASQEILSRLDTADFSLRRQLVKSLIFSGDPKLVPVVQKYLKDADAQVRLEAAYVGLNLTGEAAKTLRPALLSMLQDSDKLNRFQITLVYATKKDPVAGPALLELLPAETLGQGQHSNLVQAMNNLAGSYFDYDFTDWKPSTPHNRAAIARFAEWVAAHPAKKE